MIPLRDENPTRTFPLVAVLLILVNVAVFLHQSLLSDLGHLLFVYKYATIPAVVLGKLDVLDAIARTQPRAYQYLLAANLQPEALAPAWLSVFTSMFMHGGWAHLLGNMLYLWIFGNNVEDLLGHARFLVFYLICGLFAAGAQFLMSLSSPVPMLGASGAIAGVLGAYYLRFPHARVLTAVFFIFIFQLVYLPASLLLFVWFLLQVAQSVGALGGGSVGGVAVFAHIGGFVAGWLLIRAFAPDGRRRPRRLPRIDFD